MDEAQRVEDIKKQLEPYIFGGNQEVVKMTCKIIGITRYKNFKYL